MFSQSILIALQIYGIAIAISMLVAILIKVLVGVTGHIEKRARSAAPAPRPAAANAAPLSDETIPGDVVAAITAAVAAMGPHRILHIAESNHAWACEGRAALHSHQPQR
jgi:Na+-transporting methylmalonyl-CoA/oxaloacetate decarboxylase gamma subunit